MKGKGILVVCLLLGIYCFVQVPAAKAQTSDQTERILRPLDQVPSANQRILDREFADSTGQEQWHRTTVYREREVYKANEHRFNTSVNFGSIFGYGPNVWLNHEWVVGGSSRERVERIDEGVFQRPDPSRVLQPLPNQP